MKNNNKYRYQQNSIEGEVPMSHKLQVGEMKGSLYRYSGEWKFHAVGSGFFGGLADLCADYGVEVDSPMDEYQNPVPTIQPPTDSNQGYQTVHEREGSEVGEVLPTPTTEHIQLKRSSFVQFNESRIETLSNQSTELINLFDDQHENEAQTVQPNIIETQLTTNYFQTGTEEMDQDAFLRSLSRMDKTFLLMIENGQISGKVAKDYLKKHGLMLAFFVNTINEKANEHLDDNLLQIENESIKVYEEFKPLVEKIKERVRNEN